MTRDELEVLFQARFQEAQLTDVSAARMDQLFDLCELRRLLDLSDQQMLEATRVLALADAGAIEAEQLLKDLGR